MITIVSPHLDDAAFSLGALILNSPERIKVINVFTRSCYTLLESDKNKVFEITKLRRGEDEAALTLLCERVDYLNFPDASIRENYVSESDYLSADLDPEKDPIYAQVSDAIRKNFSENPYAIYYFPLGLGDNIDHVILRAVGESLNEESPNQIRFYEDWGYECLAREDFEFCDENLELETVVDCEAILEQKLELSSHYGSQINSEMKNLLTQTARSRGGERIYSIVS
jgi:LmbE family N-acetylglucosaminyl deacetylase